MARPLIGLVSRLTDQKGFDLIAAAADELMALDASWVMLGSGERRYEELWRALAARPPGRVSATIGFDERLAHLIEAGADMFLMPSRFEPCGLNQMYSLRYGTVPIVRATGRARGHGGRCRAGRARAPGSSSATTRPERWSTRSAGRWRRIRSADRWRAMQRRGMRQDHSWDASAREYVKVYRALTAEARARPRVSRKRAPTDQITRFHSVGGPLANGDSAMASEKVQTLTDANFEQTVNKPTPGARRFLGGVVRPVPAARADGRRAGERLRRQGRRRQAERRREPATPMRFSIRGIPTLLLFKGGQIVEQVVGLADKDALKKLIDKHV